MFDDYLGAPARVGRRSPDAFLDLEALDDSEDNKTVTPPIRRVIAEKFVTPKKKKKSNTFRARKMARETEEVKINKGLRG